MARVENKEINVFILTNTIVLKPCVVIVFYVGNIAIIFNVQ